MESGGFEIARSLFAKAVTLFKSILDYRQGGLTQSSLAQRIIYVPDFEIIYLALSNERFGFGSKGGNCECEVQERYPLYVFGRPIYFSESVMNWKNLPFSKISVALLFNLGLSYHAIALQDNIICHPFVADAIFYYQLAIEVQIKDRIELSALHTMGIINNISQLLSVKGDAGKAEESFALLLKPLMIYVDQVKLSGGRGLHQELDGFVGNVIQVLLKATLGSAAA